MGARNVWLTYADAERGEVRQVPQYGKVVSTDEFLQSKDKPSTQWQQHKQEKIDTNSPYVSPRAGVTF